ncbi:amino acid racemase [bacterium]|nr:amino acid racemase [bacterium]MCI0604009.1 amino acid racemase [bacterium]
MATLGIIGGTGPESTIEYYRQIIAAYQEQKKDGSYPSIIINSIDLKKMLELIGANQLTEVTQYLLTEIIKLAKAGADFGLLASNTPHIVFNELAAQSPIPLISIVEAARDAVHAAGFDKVGLFGTRFTMEGTFYAKVFTSSNITLVVPNEHDRTYIHDRYMNELLNGKFLPETRSDLLSIVTRLKEETGIQGLVLAGTELPLILRDKTYQGISFLDTTQIHVKRAVAKML